MSRIVMLAKAFLAKNRRNLVLALASIAISCVFAEVVFRVYLFQKIAKTEYDHLAFAVSDKSYWQHDEALGFRYRPGVSADVCSIEDSLPVSVETVVFDRRGNSGIDVDNSDSEVRIAVVGDSFTQIQHDGITWPHLLQQTLRAQTGRKVAVLNYAREGYGLVQMIDQARLLIEEKPDIILIVFISPDIVRSRFWRIEQKTPSGVDVFTSITPELQFDKPKTFVRTALVDPRATRAWAERMMATKDRKDPVLRSILDSYVRAKHDFNIARFDVFSLRESYLLARLANPGAQGVGPTNPLVGYSNFAEDRRLIEAVTRLRQSNIPVYLIHLPFYPELLKGKYLLNVQQAQLLGSLKAISEFPLLTILPLPPMGPEARSLIRTNRDTHPSRIGLDFYVEIVSRALFKDATFGRILLTR